MIRVITIDGPASSGKGTVAKILAAQLGFAYLESGAIYRALGWWVNKHYPEQDVSDAQVVDLIASMQLEFKAGLIWLNNEDVTEQLRAESIGMLASKYSSIAEVRARLLQFQRDFAKAPGLVTDGRDMGSVVFPNANLKVFLTASAEKRAERRYKQLHQFDKAVTMGAILQDIITRDEQDSQRSVAPLSYDSSYRMLDNSELSIDETISLIKAWL
ncbi:MAG: (d)CMP kinase [Burkholderiales bacterium]|nr:(d)CMP kinase [Burkholderiales bacterium]